MVKIKKQTIIRYKRCAYCDNPIKRNPIQVDLKGNIYHPGCYRILVNNDPYFHQSESKSAKQAWLIKKLYSKPGMINKKRRK